MEKKAKAEAKRVRRVKRKLGEETESQSETPTIASMMGDEDDSDTPG